MSIRDLSGDSAREKKKNSSSIHSDRPLNPLAGEAIDLWCCRVEVLGSGEPESLLVGTKYLICLTLKPRIFSNKKIKTYHTSCFDKSLRLAGIEHSIGSVKKTTWFLNPTGFAGHPGVDGGLGNKNTLVISWNARSVNTSFVTFIN